MLIRRWCVGAGLVLAGAVASTYGCSDDPEVVQESEIDGGGGENGQNGSGGNPLVGDSGGAGRLEGKMFELPLHVVLACRRGGGRGARWPDAILVSLLGI